MKLQRYDIACFQDDITPHHSGEWVKWNDVAKLEASHAELLEVLRLALRSHGVIKCSNPPKDA